MATALFFRMCILFFPWIQWCEDKDDYSNIISSCHAMVWDTFITMYIFYIESVCIYTYMKVYRCNTLSDVLFLFHLTVLHTIWIQLPLFLHHVHVSLIMIIDIVGPTDQSWFAIWTRGLYLALLGEHDFFFCPTYAPHKFTLKEQENVPQRSRKLGSQC